MKGIAYLIGAGPGDPGLLTIKGKICIEKADTVIYDYLADESLLSYAKPDAEFIYAGKQAGNHALTQEEINDLLVKYVAEGRVVARLKGGDPFVFGRGGEEALALHDAGLAFEIVPGVTSAIAAPAYAGIPVTQRAMATSFAVITGHEDPTKKDSGIDWQGLAKGADTLTFVMGLGNLPEITEKLQRYGRSGDTPAAVIRWGTKAEQQTVVGTLADIAERVKESGLKPPGLFIVGEVVSLRTQLNWRETQPLFGKRIVITRANHQAGGLADLLRERGAQSIIVPAIRMKATDNKQEQSQCIAELDQYDWLLFTSVNTVRYFFAALYREGRDARNLPENIMAVGKKTAAALAACGVVPDYVPATATAEGMLELLEQLPMEGAKVLLPRAVQAREKLPDTLRKAGAEVDVLPVYETEPDLSEQETLCRLIENGEIDVLTFTSSSTVDNILAMLESRTEHLKNVRLVAIGEITANTLRSYHMEPDMVAKEATIESLVEAVEEVCKRS